MVKLKVRIFSKGYFRHKLIQNMVVTIHKINFNNAFQRVATTITAPHSSSPHSPSTTLSFSFPSICLSNRFLRSLSESKRIKIHFIFLTSSKFHYFRSLRAFSSTSSSLGSSFSRSLSFLTSLPLAISFLPFSTPWLHMFSPFFTSHGCLSVWYIRKGVEVQIAKSCSLCHKV